LHHTRPPLRVAPLGNRLFPALDSRRPSYYSKSGNFIPYQRVSFKPTGLP